MTKCKYNKNTKTVMAMENSFYQEIENHLTSYSAMVQVKLESFIYITGVSTNNSALISKQIGDFISHFVNEIIFWQSLSVALWRNKNSF